MTNEAKLLKQTGLPVDYTVGPSSAVAKGEFLQLYDANTASGSLVRGGAVAGIAFKEKVAAETKSKIAVYEEGDFRVLVSGGVSVGDSVMFASGGVASTINKVEYCSGGSLGTGICHAMGYMKETATNGETARMRLCPHTLTGAA